MLSVTAFVALVIGSLRDIVKILTRCLSYVGYEEEEITVMPTKVFTSENSETRLLSKFDATVNDDKTVTVTIYLPDTNQKRFSHVLTLREVLELSAQIRRLIPELRGES